MAAEAALAFTLNVDACDHLALPVAAQHPGAGAGRAHQQAAVGFGHQAVWPAG